MRKSPQWRNTRGANKLASNPVKPVRAAHPEGVNLIRHSPLHPLFFFKISSSPNGIKGAIVLYPRTTLLLHLCFLFIFRALHLIRRSLNGYASSILIIRAALKRGSICLANCEGFPSRRWLAAELIPFVWENERVYASATVALLSKWLPAASWRMLSSGCVCIDLYSSFYAVDFRGVTLRRTRPKR